MGLSSLPAVTRSSFTHPLGFSPRPLASGAGHGDIERSPVNWKVGRRFSPRESAEPHLWGPVPGQKGALVPPGAQERAGGCPKLWSISRADPGTTGLSLLSASLGVVGITQDPSGRIKLARCEQTSVFLTQETRLPSAHPILVWLSLWGRTWIRSSSSQGGS